MRRKRIFWIVVLALVLAGSGGGYYYYRNVYLAAQEPAAEPTLMTTTVTRGDLVITASGSGTLTPATELAIGFRSGGILADMNVKVGDRVEAGQVLARLDDADAQAQVAQAEIGLRQAELSLAKLTEDVDPADLAAAQASLASARADLTKLTSAPAKQDLLSAQESLKSAKEALAELLAGPDPDQVAIAQADLTLAEMAVQNAQAAYDKIAHRPDAGRTQQAMDLWQATTNYEKTKAEYQEVLEGPSADEISDARAKVAQAQAQLDALLEDPDPDSVAAAEARVTQNQAQLDNQLAGASPADLESAQLNVAQAELSLTNAQRSLAEVELVAPASGTTLAVSAQVGESVGTGPVITLADLDEPLLLFWVEETDLASISLGNPVNIVFEALPDYTYPGEIISVDPALVTVDGTPAIQSYASIDLSAHPIRLLSGMNAEVEIVAGEARNAVLVPLQALRELGPESFAVFVVQSNGELEMRPVTIGLKDFVNAEVLSGLEPGEVVSLGMETDSSSSAEPATNPEGPGPGLLRFFGG